MATNLDIDTKTLEKAYKMGGFRTKRETVNLALEEFIKRRQQKRIKKLMGKIDFRKDWNYKKDRDGRELSS